MVEAFNEEKQRYAVRLCAGALQERLLLRGAALRLQTDEQGEGREAAGERDGDGVLGFDVRVRADCGGGVARAKQECQWFHFGLRGGLAKGSRLRFRMLGLSRFEKLQGAGAVCGSLLTDGMLPVVRQGSAGVCSFASGPIGVDQLADGSLAFVFDHVLGRPLGGTEELYFALTFPYPLARSHEHWTSVRRALVDTGVYARRELLVRSVEGRRVDLLTITSRSGGSRERAPVPAELASQICGRRPRLFPGRKSVFVSARVHPGETPASFMLEGLLDFLASGSGAAQALLRSYVFHVVPVLNPDGVELGHHRLDSLGENLNRVYGRATLEKHPSVYAATAACLAAHQQGGLRLYLDLHAHSNKRGVFLLGDADSLGGSGRAVGRLFGYAFSRRCPFFEYMQSDFDQNGRGTGHAWEMAPQLSGMRHPTVARPLGNQTGPGVLRACCRAPGFQRQAPEGAQRKGEGQ